MISQQYMGDEPLERAYTHTPLYVHVVDVVIFATIRTTEFAMAALITATSIGAS